MDGDTQILKVEAIATERQSASKACCRCGCDLRRARRYRDQQGYWCIACSRADHAARRARRIPCDGCGKQIDRDLLRKLEDYYLCPICAQKRLVQSVRNEMRQQAALKAQQLRRRRRRHALIVALELLLAGPVVAYLYCSSGGRSEAEPQNDPPGAVAVAAGGASAAGAAPSPALAGSSASEKIAATQPAQRQ